VRYGFSPVSSCGTMLKAGVLRPVTCLLMRTFALILLLFLPGIPAGAAQGFEGPLQVRNQFPLFLGIMPPYLESAGVQDSVTVGLSHSSTHLVERSPRWHISMDLEMTELDLRFKKRIGDSSEVGIDIPVIRPTGGFFDGPLEEWHALLPFGDYGRHERPKNAFLYEISHDGLPVTGGVNDRTGFGDVRLTGKRILSAATATISAMAAVELPTGDARTGYGNGSYDFLAALLAEWRWGSTWHGYANGGYIVPGDLKGYQTVPLRNVLYAGAGVEAGWGERWTVLVQTVVQQSPLPETGINHVDRPGVLFTFGGRYRLRGGTIELSLTEDPDVAGAPDFIANMAWVTRY
jgi:hypothetical protein